MSDERVRALERQYRTRQDPVDGEAYVQAVLRTTGLPATFLIARVIESLRAIEAITLAHESIRPDEPQMLFRLRNQVNGARGRRVTPDDMVSFLRGGHEWLVGHKQEQPLAEDLTALGLVDAGVLPVSAVVDPNAHLPYRRGVPRGDAILCNHANENPGHCSCDEDCYCRRDGHTCSDVSSEPNPFDRQCDYCWNEATWRFRHTTVVPNGHVNGRRVEVVCGAHLAQAREESATFNYDFMNRQATEQRVAMLRDSHRHMDSLDEMVRHHESVDGDVRHCANGPCGKALPMNHLSIYCSARCAFNDA